MPVASRQLASRQRRWGLAIVADAMLLAAVVLAAGCAPGRSGITATTALRATPPMDVVVGRELWLADGRRLPLAGENSIVQRVPTGWLVVSRYPAAGVWLITDDGHEHELLRDEHWPIVAPDGGRLAYQDGDRIVVARLDGARLVTVASTSGIARWHPNRFVGDHLLLSYTETGGSVDGYDLWYPDRGPFRASAHSPDGLEIVGQTSEGFLANVASEGGRCLALVTDTTFRTVRRACLAQLLVPQPVPVSPDGRWLIGVLDGGKPSSGGQGNPPALIDLTAFFADPRVAGQWRDDPDRPIDLSHCVWRDGDATCATPGGLATMSPNTPGEIRWLVLPGIPMQPGTGRPYPAIPVPVLG